MKASQEVLDDIRAHIGQTGYPGGCVPCRFESANGEHNRNPNKGHDTIICIGCGETDKAADHNHVLCWECEGIAHLRRK